MEVLTKQLVEATIVPANVSQDQAMRSDFYGQGHTNGNFIPEGVLEEAKY